MSQLTAAAVQLINQVTQLNPKVAAKAVDTPDGFNRHRAVEFDGRTSKWLVPALNAINDERIASIDYEGKGRAVVTFVGDVRADHRYPEYPLESVLAVLRGEDKDD